MEMEQRWESLFHKYMERYVVHVQFVVHHIAAAAAESSAGKRATESC